MVDLILTWVPYAEANEETRFAFVDAGHGMRSFAGDPSEMWTCEKCAEDHVLNDLGLTYQANGMAVTWPMPVCPTSGCPGHGWLDLHPKKDG